MVIELYIPTQTTSVNIIKDLLFDDTALAEANDEAFRRTAELDDTSLSSTPVAFRTQKSQRTATAAIIKIMREGLLGYSIHAADGAFQSIGRHARTSSGDRSRRRVPIRSSRPYRIPAELVCAFETTENWTSERRHLIETARKQLFAHTVASPPECDLEPARREGPELEFDLPGGLFVLGRVGGEDTAEVVATRYLSLYEGRSLVLKLFVDLTSVDSLATDGKFDPGIIEAGRLIGRSLLRKLGAEIHQDEALVHCHSGYFWRSGTDRLEDHIASVRERRASS